MSSYLLSRIPDCECSRAKYLERKDFVLSSAYGMKYSIENALKNPQDTQELILSHSYPLLKREYNELAFARTNLKIKRLILFKSRLPLPRHLFRTNKN